MLAWAFEFMGRRGRFGLFGSRRPGFTRGRGREVQFKLDILPPVVLETHGLITAPFVRAFSHRSRLGLSVDSAFRHLECLTSLADVMTYYALC